MSHFFADIEAEEPEQKKKQPKFEEESSEEEGLSKKEQKTNALRLEVLQAEENMTNKTVEKVLKTVNKNLKLFKNESFLKKFFVNVKAQKKINQSIKQKIKEIEEKITDKEEIVSAKPRGKRTVNLMDELAAILNLSDFNVKIRKFDELLSRCENEGEKFKILFTKLLILLQAGILKKDLFVEIAQIYENNKELSLEGADLKRIFVMQIKIYLSLILNNISTEKKDEFYEIAEILRKYDPVGVEKKVLEFKYFKLKEVVENEHPEFKLLYLVNHDQKTAVEYFKTNRDFLMKSEEVTILDSLLQLGDYLYKHNEFLESFLILQRCYYCGHSELEEKLLILCVILDEKIQTEKFYEHFLDSLNLLDKNPLLLPSENGKLEILRAFFLLNCYDYLECSKILKKISPELKCEEIFEGRVMDLIDY